MKGFRVAALLCFLLVGASAASAQILDVYYSDDLVERESVVRVHASEWGYGGNNDWYNPLPFTLTALLGNQPAEIQKQVPAGPISVRPAGGPQYEIFFTPINDYTPEWWDLPRASIANRVVEGHLDIRRDGLSCLTPSLKQEVITLAGPDLIGFLESVGVFDDTYDQAWDACGIMFEHNFNQGLALPVIDGTRAAYTIQNIRLKANQPGLAELAGLNLGERDRVTEVNGARQVIRGSVPSSTVESVEGGKLNLTYTDGTHTDAVTQLSRTRAGYGQTGRFLLWEREFAQPLSDNQGNIYFDIATAPIVLTPAGGPTYRITFTPIDPEAVVGSAIKGHVTVTRDNVVCHPPQPVSLQTYFAYSEWQRVDARGCGVSFDHTWSRGTENLTLIGQFISILGPKTLYLVRRFEVNMSELTGDVSTKPGERVIDMDGQAVAIPEGAPLQVQVVDLDVADTSQPKTSRFWFQLEGAVNGGEGVPVFESYNPKSFLDRFWGHPAGHFPGSLKHEQFELSWDEGERNYVSFSALDGKKSWSIKVNSHEPTGQLDAVKVDLSIHRSPDGTGPACFREEVALQGYGAAAIVQGEGLWTHVAAPRCGIFFVATWTKRDVLGIPYTENLFGKTDLVFAAVGLSVAGLERGTEAALVNAVQAEENQLKIEEGVTRLESGQPTRPGQRPQPGDTIAAGNYLDEEGRIRHYYVRYTPEALAFAAEKMNMSPNDPEVLDGIFSAMEMVNESSGVEVVRVDPREVAGEEQTRGGPTALDTEFCMDCRSLFRQYALGTLIKIDGAQVRGGTDDTLVFGGIFPGNYLVTYTFNDTEKITVRWTISADPNAPLRQAVVESTLAPEGQAAPDQPASTAGVEFYCSAWCGSCDGTLAYIEECVDPASGKTLQEVRNEKIAEVLDLKTRGFCDPASTATKPFTRLTFCEEEGGVDTPSSTTPTPSDSTPTPTTTGDGSPPPTITAFSIPDTGTASSMAVNFAAEKTTDHCLASYSIEAGDTVGNTKLEHQSAISSCDSFATSITLDLTEHYGAGKLIVVTLKVEDEAGNVSEKSVSVVFDSSSTGISKVFDI